MACDLWLVPLVDVLTHSPENPFRDDLVRYNAALVAHGLPEVPVYRYSPELSGSVEPIAAFDYDSLHFLRRAYLLGLTGFAIEPVDALGGDYEQLLEMFESTAEQSHLVWHFDHAGAYVPIDFQLPLVADELLAAGGPLGSSYGLLRELQAVAPVLGLDPLNPPAPTRPLAPTDLEQTFEPPIDDQHPFARERHAWAGLYAAATRSVTQGSMIVFA
ncbi:MULTISPECIES: hypothetical protein [unclassified Kitasatospora]|uniref:hypothetical protein n=1 Tax=unclassified Kitasatospora TaxID=2633591 RepID=UPI00070F1BB0|nr:MULTISPECIES: hypothetical protein [unclassified Kitasatospora]KQV19559.1 hypothetical protein ASC99_23045 [Kitasatospora sp. Root107]KRB72926.1 hypothetical protein ASE03_21935 [Kitasatospora sp. Root187]